GWNYRTLEVHVEMGQMAWGGWIRLGDGRVDFRVHAVARVAPIRNPIVRLGFSLLREHERQVFLESTKERMRRFTELALAHPGDQSIREAAAELTARPLGREDAAHDSVARGSGRG